jgi:hypothetical protein
MTIFTTGTALRNIPQGDKSRGKAEGSRASVMRGGDLDATIGGSAGAAGSAAGAASCAGDAVCARTGAAQRIAPSAKAARIVLAKP